MLHKHKNCMLLRLYGSLFLYGDLLCQSCRARHDLHSLQLAATMMSQMGMLCCPYVNLKNYFTQ